MPAFPQSRALQRYSLSTPCASLLPPSYIVSVRSAQVPRDIQQASPDTASTLGHENVSLSQGTYDPVTYSVDQNIPAANATTASDADDLATAPAQSPPVTLTRLALIALLNQANAFADRREAHGQKLANARRDEAQAKAQQLGHESIIATQKAQEARDRLALAEHEASILAARERLQGQGRRG
ncbi:hypothetical protein BOTBODRAFT_190471 [Botryobasidium botryosum FD-172 SS1]|uniref:Uncharacterized protein n=1 Tax=Botryobasidium botryosum (strain FD-172 SS1) TaxID=930990 RepID=A0A067M3Z4_BOTB1|nr:hypothetical protein BOTBODRAFT_190471 [Botryobasidium botryosum FD-172 SS1]